MEPCRVVSLDEEPPGMCLAFGRLTRLRLGRFGEVTLSGIFLQRHMDVEMFAFPCYSYTVRAGGAQNGDKCVERASYVRFGLGSCAIVHGRAQREPELQPAS